MAVKRSIIHTWRDRPVYDGSELHPYWAVSSARQLLEINLSSADALIENAEDTAIEYADGIESIILKGEEAVTAGSVGRRSDEYSIYIHGWSNREAMRAMTDPADRLEDWFTDYPGDADNSGPYIANGLADSKAWADIFLDTLKSELDSRDLPYPSRMHWDTEDTLNEGSIYATVPSSSGYEGWMDYAYNDARATTELVDGINTFKQLVDNWSNIDDEKLVWDNTSLYWNSVNKDLREFIGHVTIRIRDWIHYEGFMKKAKLVFPGITWGNWNHGYMGTKENPGLGRGKASQRLFIDQGPWSDWCSPALYPLRASSFQDTGSSKFDHADNIGIEISSDGPPYDEDYSALWTGVQRANVETAILAEGGPEYYCPWINPPGEYYGMSSSFLDGVDILTVANDGAKNFRVGNTVSIQNSSEVELYTADIVKVYSHTESSYRVNVANISPTDEGNFGSAAYAVDSELGIRTDVISLITESTYFYVTTKEDVQSVLDKCIEQGVTEYIFWQNTPTDSQWLEIAELMSHIEEGLGVRLGEALTPRIESSGREITMRFDPPANGPWVLDNLEIDSENKPEIIRGQSSIPYNEVELSDLSIDTEGVLNITITLTNAFIQGTERIDIRIKESWILDSSPQFRNAATTSVTQGEGSNPESFLVRAENRSRFRNENSNARPHKNKQSKKNKPGNRAFVSEINRMPVAVIQGFIGGFDLNCDTDENEFGTPCWWRGDEAVLNLIDRVETLYRQGWRRIWFSQPMGGTANGIVPSSSWTPLTDEKKEGLLSDFKDYLKSRVDLSMGIYVGFPLSDSSSSLSASTDTIRSYDFGKQADIEQMRENLLPWSQVGISEIGCGLAGNDIYKDAFLKYARLGWTRDIICRGEPFPKIKQDGIYIPDESYIDRVPWMFFEQELGRVGSTDFWTEWEIDPEESDVSIVLQGREDSLTETDTEEARAYIDNWYDRGFNLIAWNNASWYANYILSKYN